MQIVNFFLIAYYTIVGDKFIKEIRGCHTDQITQLFGSIEPGEEGIGGEKKCFGPDKIAAEDESSLVADIDEQSCLVGIGKEKKISDCHQQYTFYEE